MGVGCVGIIGEDDVELLLSIHPDEDDDDDGVDDVDEKSLPFVVVSLSPAPVVVDEKSVGVDVKNVGVNIVGVMGVDEVVMVDSNVGSVIDGDDVLVSNDVSSDVMTSGVCEWIVVEKIVAVVSSIDDD